MMGFAVLNPSYALVGLDVQFPHEPPEFFVVIVDQPGELFGSTADGLLRGLQEIVTNSPDP